jgi:hypothetical protein
MNTSQPNRPFYLWLEDVRRIAEHNGDKLGYIPFWWDCYRKNYSPVGAHSYNMGGATISTPKDKKEIFKQKPFTADDDPDIMADLGYL